jgi:diacylglycerol kinase family enzyme
LKHLFIINPKSFPDKKIMSDFLMSVTGTVGSNSTVLISRYPRDAISKVNNFLKDAEESGEKVRVYAVGGDGILFDCVNGMVKYPGHELASVPYGNANDFLRAFGEENVPLFRDIKTLSASPAVDTDTFRCGENVAIANAAIGLESSSILETEKLAKKLARVPFLRKLIPLLYIFGAVIVLFDKNLRSQYYELTLDGKDYSGEYVDINIGNSYANGGKNAPNPYAVPNDGYLDAVFIKKMPLIKCLMRVSAFTNGNFEKYPDDFFYVRFKKLHAKSENNVRICVDGEAFVTSDLNIEVYPNALKIAAPEGVNYRPYRELKND